MEKESSERMVPASEGAGRGTVLCASMLIYACARGCGNTRGRGCVPKWAACHSAQRDRYTWVCPVAVVVWSKDNGCRIWEDNGGEG